jgi:hypothetical protein
METLIAIGTHAGMVLVFNMLGLLIHEIIMAVPVIGIEWIEDMSAPTALPNRPPLLSPEPRPAVDWLDEDSEESGTVHVSPRKRAANRYQIPDVPNLFSAQHARPASIRPLSSPSDILTGSPAQAQRSHEHPRRKSLIRPRIATETFKSPTLSSDRVPPATTRPSLRPTLSKHETKNWPEEHGALPVPLKLPARFLPGYRNSPLMSSQESDTSEQEFFTPLVTKRDNSKASFHLTNPRVSLITTRSPRAHRGASSLSSSSILTSPSSPPYSQMGSFAPYHSRQRRTRFIRRTPQRQLTVDLPDTRSSPGPQISDQRRPSTTLEIPQRILPSLGSSSGVYLKRISRSFQNAVKPGDGELGRTDSSTAASRKDVHSDDQEKLRFKVAMRKRSATIGVSDEVRRLRDSNEMLRKDMDALREEFRALRNVLVIGSKRR